MSQVKQGLEDLVRWLVDYPDEVEVETFRGDRALEIDLYVAPEDLGKVIGRQGRTALALRTLLELRGDRDQERYELRILDGEDG